MKKILTLLVVMIFAVTMVSAQDKSFGVRAGLNLSNMYSNAPGEVYGIRPGINFGIVYAVCYPSGFLFQPGVCYSMKGTRDKGSGVIDGYTAQADVKVILHYLEVPASFGYRIKMSPGLDCDLYAGPYLAYGLGGKMRSEVKIADAKLQGNDIQPFSSDLLKNFDMGLNLGVGFRIGDHFNCGAQYGVGLLNIVGDQMKLANKTNTSIAVIDYKLRNYSLSLNVGYNF